jgi:hypothetical protein
MKKIFYPLFFVALFSCNQATKPTVDTEKEKAAILKAVEDESRNFYKKDLALWSQSYLQNNDVHWACVEKDVTLRAKGFDDLKQFVGEWMKANPIPVDYEKAQFKNSNVKVTLDATGNTAFVSFEQTNIQPDSTLRNTVGSRTMIKENNTWKILSMTSYPNDSTAGSTKNIYVHKESK